MRSTAILRAYFSKIGAKGGRQAAANMTPDERRARALKAVRAREAKRKAIYAACLWMVAASGAFAQSVAVVTPNTVIDVAIIGSTAYVLSYDAYAPTQAQVDAERKASAEQKAYLDAWYARCDAACREADAARFRGPGMPPPPPEWLVPATANASQYTLTPKERKRLAKEQKRGKVR
jgi:hypothetical protein